MQFVTIGQRRVRCRAYPQSCPPKLGRSLQNVTRLPFCGDQLRGPAVNDLILPDIIPIADAAPAEVEALLDAAFGQDRHLRTAYRLREGLRPIAELSFAAIAGGRLVGTLQSWPVALRGTTGSVPLILVGPVAVHPDSQRRGIGHALMAALLAADPGLPMVLIGDTPYYGRFGFAASPERQWTLPGPFDAARLLVRESADRPLPLTGELGPRHD
jgi:predicted N-acetyltransferase YhbS